MLRQALSWMRFAPAGIRGYGINPTMIGYENHTFPEIIAHLNANTVSVVQFETVTAMERADELLSVPGLDIAMVGPADLSISLGVPASSIRPCSSPPSSASSKNASITGWSRGLRLAAPPWPNSGPNAVRGSAGAGGEHGLLLKKARETVAALRAGKTPRLRVTLVTNGPIPTPPRACLIGTVRFLSI